MAIFTMAVGLPGSGKSFYSSLLSDTIIFSSDLLRKELWGSEEMQGDNNLIFTTLQNRIISSLKNGNDCFLDATNLNSKKRKNFLKQLPTCVKEVFVFATPLDVCLRNNKMRERHVPVEVIERMYREFQFPLWGEGWDDIQIINHPERYEYIGTLGNKIQKLYSFNQESKYHSLSLGQHCLSCGYEFFNKTGLLAGYFHDFGKEKTKTFIKANGQEDQYAHYYGHENVSAYETMLYLCDDTDRKVLECQLVQAHMLPYLLKEEQVKEKVGRIYDQLMILHECDKNAH